MKKLLVITGDTYVRNYFETGVFADILDDNTFICAADHLKELPKLQALPNFVGTFHYSDAVKKRYTQLFNVLMLRHRDRSQTFWFRYMRLWFSQTIHWQQIQQRISERPAYRWLSKMVTPWGAKALLLGSESKMLRKMAASARELWFTRLLGRPGLADWYQRRTEQRIQPNAELEAIVSRVQPELVMIPSQAIEPTGTDLLRLKEKYGYKTFFLIDNWDNLSSKSVFPYLPDYLGVWGEQSVDHAESVHHIPRDRVFKLGTARFDDYFRVLEAAEQGAVPPSPHAFPYILFTGCSLPYDETTALDVLEATLADVNKDRAVSLKVLYRPHPWRLRRYQEIVFNPDDYQFVVMDPSVSETYYNRLGEAFQPRVDDYPALLYNAELVVGPLTSMLVESALFHKPILALAYDDGIHLTSPHNALKYYKHFEGIDQIPDFTLLYHLSELPAQLKNTLAHASQPDLKKHSGDSILEYYLYQDERTYPQRLKDALTEIERKHGSHTPETARV